MKRIFQTFTCAMLLVAAARSNAQEVTPVLPPVPSPDAGVVGDEPGFVGDQPGTVGDFSAIGDLSPVGDLPSREGDGSVGDMQFVSGRDQVGDLFKTASVPSSSFVGDDESAGGEGPAPIGELEPVADAPISHAPIASSGAVCSPQMFQVRTKTNKWLRYDTLLWWVEERDTPPLIATGANSVTQFGDPISSGLAPGFRVDYGHYFGDGTIGLGLKVSGLFGEDEDYQISSTDPANVITRPFFNTNGIGGPQFDQLIVSGLGPTTGSFSATSEFDYLASEVYGRMNFDKSSNYSIDLIGGFSAFMIDDMLSLTSISDQGGTRTTLNDMFDVENRFYGGQLGIETMFHKGKWSLTTLTKVHLGNMNNRVAISGSSRNAVLPDPPGPGADFTNGFFVQGQQGTYEDDEFSFAPELGLRLGYSPRCNVELTVGYSMIYWNNVALAGEQINPYLDGTLILSNTAGAQAALYEVEKGSLWMQGIDLGVIFHY